MGENSARLLKVAWMTFPLGILFTLAGCALVLWWQGLGYQSPYAQAILINGKMKSFYELPKSIFYRA